MAVKASAHLRHQEEQTAHDVRRARAGRRGGVRRLVPAKVESSTGDLTGDGDSETDKLREAELRRTARHLQHIPQAQRPLLPAPEAVDEEALRRREIELLVEEVPWFRRRARAAARAEAHRNVEAQIARLRIARIESLERAQERSDQMWQALLTHEPQPVRHAVEAAFDPADGLVLVLDVRPRGGRQSVCLAVAVDGLDSVPELTVLTAPDGTQQVRPRTSDELHACHLRSIASTVLAAIARVLAASPATRAVTVVAATPAAADAGAHVWSAVYAGTFERDVVESTEWREHDPVRTVLDSDGSAVRLTGPHGELGALEPSAHPDVHRALAAISARSRATS